MGNNAYNFAFGLIFVASALFYARHNAVVIHGAVKQARRNKHIRPLAFVIGNNKTKALACKLKTPNYKPHTFR